MNIGIVTEDEQAGAAIHKTLTYEKHEAHWYSNAQEAMASVLNAQQNGQPSHEVMLVDLCLQGSIDGAEFIKRVRERLPNTKTRFILITSRFDTGYDALMKKHLFDVHLMRKHSISSLLRQIEAFEQPDEVVEAEKPVEFIRAPVDKATPPASTKKSIPSKAQAKKDQHGSHA